MKKFIILLYLILSSTIPFVASASVWFTSTVKRVYPLANGDFVVLFNDVNTKCVHESGYHYIEVNRNGITESGRDKMYSAFFVAGSAKNQVKIFFDETSSNCNINRMQVLFE